MARVIVRLLEDGERFKEYLATRSGAESILRLGSVFLINHAGSEEKFALFREAIEQQFMIAVFRELCHGKCRDGSDCLNTARVGKYCQKHQCTDVY